MKSKYLVPEMLLGQISGADSEIFFFTERNWTMDRFWLALQLKDDHFFDSNWIDLTGTVSVWFPLDLTVYFL